MAPCGFSSVGANLVAIQHNPSQNGFVGYEAPAMVIANPSGFHSTTLDAVLILIAANATKTYLAALTPEGSPLRPSDKGEDGAHSHLAHEEAALVSTPSPPVQAGSWKPSKSQRRRKSTPKHP
ncbi:hypothetical protein Nepgr_017497 [Nepenthes gracilis]|uniref:Uncharacterized protein n=1 Tax=Nepenthes gracilis TaxID=150966 RepID=A0AAD3SS55_NEPGR|nr:hypothetical protein Nepgr_017497 [Nepenthes gracilis]